MGHGPCYSTMNQVGWVKYPSPLWIIPPRNHFHIFRPSIEGHCITLFGKPWDPLASAPPVAAGVLRSLSCLADA